MEAKALEHLVKLANATKPDTDFGCEIIPDGMRVASLERFMEVPYRFRGSFSTESLSAFKNYCDDLNNGANSAVFINALHMRADAIFDYGSAGIPDWCGNTAALTLTMLPGYKTLLENRSTPLFPRSLIDMFLDYEPVLTFYDSEEKELPMAGVLNAFRHVQVTKSEDLTVDEEDFNHELTDMERISVESTSSIQLPAYFEMGCFPYEELDPVVIRCRIRAHLEDKQPSFSYRIDGFELIETGISNNFLEVLKTALSETKMKIYIGSFEAAYGRSIN